MHGETEDDQDVEEDLVYSGGEEGGLPWGREGGEGREGFGSEVSVVVLSRSTWTFLGFVGAATP